jgi:hypothetical protein
MLRRLTPAGMLVAVALLLALAHVLREVLR